MIGKEGLSLRDVVDFVDAAIKGVVFNEIVVQPKMMPLTLRSHC